jgi:hypothetical protein
MFARRVRCAAEPQISSPSSQYGEFQNNSRNPKMYNLSTSTRRRLARWRSNMWRVIQLFGEHSTALWLENRTHPALRRAGRPDRFPAGGDFRRLPCGGISIRRPSSVPFFSAQKKHPAFLHIMKASFFSRWTQRSAAHYDCGFLPQTRIMNQFMNFLFFGDGAPTAEAL